MTDLTEKSLEDLAKLMHEGFDKYRITPTRLIVPPWACKEIIEQYGELTEENYFKWHKARYGI